MTRAFAAAGGGMLVLGARSFVKPGLVGTPLEEVLPLEFSDRGRRRASRIVAHGITGSR